MSHRPPIQYTDTQIGLMWDRWQRGESLHQIAQLFDRPHSSVRRILAETGGIRPAVRHRADRTLTVAEREEISRTLMAGQSIRSVAVRPSRTPSTISREIRRNGGPDRYRASCADQCAWERARRPKLCKLAQHRTLARLVAAKLQQQWAPEQIAGWLKRTYPRNEALQVSHETIYRSLSIQARGALKKSSWRTFGAHEPCVARGITRKRRISMRRSPAPSRSANVPPTSKIAPCQAIGRVISCLAAGIARSPRWSSDGRALLCWSSWMAGTVRRWYALIKHADKLPRELYRTLTWDRGSEMAQHQRFTLATDIKVYFCDPYNPWQRGSNENTNGLLRQYFPKGMDLSGFSQAQLDAVARRLNGRPRKTLDYETPVERFHQTVATAG